MKTEVREKSIRGEIADHANEELRRLEDFFIEEVGYSGNPTRRIRSA